MQHGMRIAASGAMVALHHTDVMANNLANVNTVGFKPDNAMVRSRAVVRIEDDLPFLPSDSLLERLGAGVLAGPRRTSFRQGPMQTTDNPLDLAIEGTAFFMVRLETDQGAQTALTRDGRFTRDAMGRLVQSATGMPILGPGQQPIFLPEGPVTIDPHGRISDTQGNTVATIGVLHVEDPHALHKQGEGLFLAPPQAFQGATDALASGARIHQGMLEGSGVDPIRAMMEITDAGRAVAGNSRMIGYHDQLLDQAINTFARVA